MIWDGLRSRAATSPDGLADREGRVALTPNWTFIIRSNGAPALRRTPFAAMAGAVVRPEALHLGLLETHPLKPTAPTRKPGAMSRVMWLTGRLVPDRKTKADFRIDNGQGIRKACARFVELCRQIGVLSGGSVAIDGSKFKAVNNRDRNFTSGTHL
jgi:hypothetical protein